ncbi:hypothetical protein GOBAR_DD03177 [Gossypium barbadense]|nr:hypothetical protein GOBAR_DD03177 [Gossypium barbadense]
MVSAMRISEKPNPSLTHRWGSRFLDSPVYLRFSLPTKENLAMEEQVDYDHRSIMVESGMQIDPRRERFPYCIVWTPLPITSWLIPFIGHIGICREDGVILDFAGPSCVSIDDFAFGAVARYIQINKDKERIVKPAKCNILCFLVTCECTVVDIVAKHFEYCISYHSSALKGDQEYQHDDLREALTWDDALEKGIQEFQHRPYNLFTCNCHSFVANNLNRLGFHSGGWNVVNLAVLIFLNGRWVNKTAVLRSHLPFVVVSGIGLVFGGTTYLSLLALLVFLLVGWFLLGTYCFKNLIYL